MQTCSRCQTQAPDDETNCQNCGVDLKEWSETAVALKDLQANPRVTAIRIFVQEDCCPNCEKAYGTYAKDKAPTLPVEGCSHQQGCRCFYAPVLSEIYP